MNTKQLMIAGVLFLSLVAGFVAQVEYLQKTSGQQYMMEESFCLWDYCSDWDGWWWP